MTEQHEIKLFGKPDWQWVGMSYCFFVVFHLLPAVIMMSLSRADLGIGWNIGTVIWMFFGLALVGGYIGYKSKGVTIIEPAISAVVYTLTLIVCIRAFWSLPIGWGGAFWSTIASLLAAFAVAFVSAWVGENLQLKVEGQTKS